MSPNTSEPDRIVQTKSPTIRLSVMMFLQYAIWGAWLPLFFPFLLNHRGLPIDQVGNLIAFGAMGALFAPFIAGQIADRWFNTERFLAISHIVGGLLVWQMASAQTFVSLAAYSLLYGLIYAPTLPLTNSLAFHHLSDRDKQFGRVRVWGTIGWIVVGLGIGQWLYNSWTPNGDEPAPGISIATIYEDPQTAIPAAVSANPRHLENVLAEDTVDRAKRAAVSNALKQANKDVPQTQVADGQDEIDYPAAVAALAVSDEELARLETEQLSSMIVSGSQAKGMADSLRLSGLLGILMGLFCITLPKTPPQPGREKFAPFEALGHVFKKPMQNPLFWLFVISFPISCVHQFYFVHTAQYLNQLDLPAASFINRIFGVGGGGLMTVGQMAEIAVLALMPLVAKRMQRKTLLTAGLCAYILRFAVFAFLPEPWAVIPALALHGFCFGCFFFIAFMIVDEENSPDVRASAQGLYNLIVVGVGIIVGSWFAGMIGEAAMPSPDAAMDYRFLFSVPLWITVACLAALLLLYPRKRAALVT